MYKKLPKILPIIFFSIFSFLQVFAEVIPAKFYTTSSNLKTGEIVEFELRLDSNPNLPIYTLAPELVYDSTKFKIVNVEAMPGWIMVPTENKNSPGAVTRVLGYPGGVSSLTQVLKYKFQAIDAGKLEVKVVGGKAYDANNNVHDLENKNITINVSGEKLNIAPEQKITTQYSGPTELSKTEDFAFTVDLKISEALETTGSVLVTLFDINGEAVAADEKQFKISDNAEIPFTFSSEILQPGDYSLIVSTKYNSMFEDRITKNFVVQDSSWFEKMLDIVYEYIYYVLGSLLIAGAVYVFFWTRGNSGKKKNRSTKK